MADITIVDNPTVGRFEFRTGEHVAELVYRLDRNRLILIHTGVPTELGGRGLGGQLVRAAIDKARAENLVIDPQCPFARDWLQQHPDESQGVAITPRNYG
jgi:predicted GNAT family acetyltransferase